MISLQLQMTPLCILCTLCFWVWNNLPRGVIGLLTRISRFWVYTLEILVNLPGTNPPRHRRLTILSEGYTFWVYHSDRADGLFSRTTRLLQTVLEIFSITTINQKNFSNRKSVQLQYVSHAIVGLHMYILTHLCYSTTHTWLFEGD